MRHVVAICCDNKFCGVRRFSCNFNVRVNFVNNAAFVLIAYFAFLHEHVIRFFVAL